MHSFAVKIVLLITVMTLLLELVASSEASSQVSPDPTISKPDSSVNHNKKSEIKNIAIFAIIWFLLIILWLLLRLNLLSDLCSMLISGYRSVKQRIHHFLLRACPFIFHFVQEHRNREPRRRRPGIIPGMRPVLPDILDGLRDYALRNPNERISWEDYLA